MLAVTGAGSDTAAFRARRTIVPSAEFGSDTDWRERYEKQKRSWMRRRSLEKRIERLGEAILVQRGRLMGAFAIGLVGAGLLAFGLIAGR